MPTALFVAMFVLLLSTVMVASVSHNLNLSLAGVESTECRYLSLAAANELLSELNAGTADPQQVKDRNSARVYKSEGTESRAWVDTLPNGTYMVVAETKRGRSHTETVKCLVALKEFSVARVYTNVTDMDRNSPDPIFFSDLSASGAWSRLPDPPRMHFDSTGKLIKSPDEKAGTIPYVSGAPDGSIYACYTPVLDGLGDILAPAYFPGLEFVPVPLPWGLLTVQTLVAGKEKGMTVGDLAPVAQTLVNHLTDVTVSKGGVMLKFSHDSGEWEALPCPEEAIVDSNKQVQVQTGNFHVQGIAGPPAAFEGGLVVPAYRRGDDTLYRYTDESKKWEVLKPPGKDVLLVAADEQGTTFVQTGTIHSPGWDYFLMILGKLFTLDNIKPRIDDRTLAKHENGKWTSIENPPAVYYDKTGKLAKGAYPSAGPQLSGMVGGQNGEFFVVNHPSDSKMVDTIYKFSEGEWEAVPSPPNKHYDNSGQVVEESGPPARLELGMGANGRLIMRVPTTDGPNAIFEQTQGGAYDLLPPVRVEDGPFQTQLSQTSGGRKRDGNSRGYVVRATYF